MRPLFLLPLIAACSPTTSTNFDPTVAGAAPRWATADRYVGPVAADERVAIQVHLSLRDLAGAEATLRDISDPKSANFRHYLSDAELDAKYLPTAADVAAVRAHLEQHGLRVTLVPDNRAFVAAEGSAAQIERAFSTKLGAYQVGAEVRRAPLSPAHLPAAIAPRVRSVLGLSTPMEMRSRAVSVGGVQPYVGEDPDATAPAPTCAAYFGAATDTTDPQFGGRALNVLPCGNYPAQLRKAYGFDDAVKKGLDGTGVKVAIVDAFMSPTLFADAQTYFAAHDPDHPLDAAHFSAQMGPGTPPPRVQTGWYSEQSLDVEAIHAIAPGATIVYVGAQSANDQDLIAALNLIISGSLATIISNSYGGQEAGSTLSDLDPWHQIATQAGLKGVGLYFSSGDDGDEATQTDDGKPTADFPASLDNATAVGGTSLALRENGNRLWELGWETGVSRVVTPTTDAGVATGPAAWDSQYPGAYVFGAGGGVSALYNQPAWQKFAVPNSISHTSNGVMRAVPDVAMLADPETGFMIGMTNPKKMVYGESQIGGTSLACPLFSASVALAEQLGGTPVGFSSPLLYTAAWLGAFRDVRPAEQPQSASTPKGGVAINFDIPSQTIKTGWGYDTVTGLGVPNGRSFLTAVGLLDVIYAAVNAAR